MGFAHILGQPTAVATLQAALHGGRAHHAYRFEGPAGVGKELCAFAFAKALICPNADPNDPALQRAFRLSDEAPHVPHHPDLVLVARGLYRDTLEANEATGISIEQIRKVVLPRAGFPPHQGSALVFLIKDAEELTVSAASALLKTLEEPRPKVHFLLLSSNPERLLDTVRSRTLPIRFSPLSDEVIRTILQRAGKSPDVAELAQGSASLALQLADDEQLQARTQFIRAALDALSAPHFAAALELSTNLPKDRDALREQLRGLSHHFAACARTTVTQKPQLALQAAKQFGLVLEAIRGIERNGQPTLVVEAMLNRLRHA